MAIVSNPPLLEPNAPLPAKGFVVTTLLIVEDIEDDEPAVLRLANTWLLINRGGGPTDDKR